ncbi:uncharacterized protein LOC123932505 isoform X1 [Meles meles]|uniref:uncharacterized protein LOC123932505 isoform X1 n=1 Tax=Meles meles TaxID=9662 RepID=UPI001E69AE3A|nr:uncharacterized protein LOC123932505 isoform X1 [Meles meles]
METEVRGPWFLYGSVLFCLQPPVRALWSGPSPSCWPPDIPSLFMFFPWLGFPADLSSRPRAPHLPRPVQTPCAFPLWPRFLEPQACAPGLVRTVSRTGPDARGRPGVPPALGARVTPGALPSGRTWRPPRVWSQLSFATASWHCPQDRPSAVPVVLSRVGQGLLWATSACSGPALGNGLWRGGPGPPPCLRPSPFLPAVMPVAISSTPLFNSGVVCGENPRLGHTVTWPAWASAASGVPCPCLSGGRVHTLVLRLAAFPLCSLPEVPPPRFLSLAVVPGNSGAGVRSNWRACIVAGGLCLTLGRGAGVLVDLPLGAWCHGGPCSCPVVFSGAVALVPWLSVIF